MKPFSHLPAECRAARADRRRGGVGVNHGFLEEEVLVLGPCHMPALWISLAGTASDRFCPSGRMPLQVRQEPLTLELSDINKA